MARRAWRPWGMSLRDLENERILSEALREANAQLNADAAAVNGLSNATNNITSTTGTSTGPQQSTWVNIGSSPWVAQKPPLQPLPAPPPAPAPPQLVAGPTIAFRLWPVYDDGRNLWLGSLATNTDEVWSPGFPRPAQCKADPPGGYHHMNAIYTALTTGALPPPDPPSHTVPHRNCGCGWYAVKATSLLDLYREPVQETKYGKYVGIVAGALSMWGRVIEHEHGYRAQYAAPSVLWPFRPAYVPLCMPTPRYWLTTLLAVAERYACRAFPEMPAEFTR